ncbi:MAG TPA: protein kinase [Gemmatimonadales bacterium]|nr:protein kinase [Gemmatimonadales bacterium]
MGEPTAILDAALAGRYRIERHVGEGGMATVYLAHDIRHNRKVAIKVLRPELAAVLGPDRFLKEIEVTANLQHPHILGLIESGALDGQLYYVMPFMEGESLRQRLARERQLAIEETISITSAVASALDYAHRQGVIHRDVKPENILLHDGQPMVADFGIALAVSHAAGSRLTHTGISLGTPFYMSPEQASGERHLDGRTDIYSLGCVAYEMLSGMPPFLGATAQAVLSAIMTGQTTPVTSRRPTVPAHVAAAIHTALEKVPADRFETAGEFAEALRRPTPRTTRRLEVLSEARKRSRTGWLVGAAALVSLGIGLAVGALLLQRQASPSPATRYWNLMLSPETPLALTGPGPLGIWQSAVALAPRGDVLAYVAPRGSTTVLAVRPLDRDSARVLPGTDGAYHPFFSPDGTWVAFFTGSELRKIPTAGGTPTTLTTVERPSGATWLEDDRILLFQQDGFQMRWVSATGGGIIDSMVTLPTQFGVPSVLPGGRWVVGQLGSGQLAILSLLDATLHAITRRGVVPLDSVKLADLLFGTSPRYVPSGHLVFGSDDGVLMALPFDLESRTVRGEPVPVVSGVRIEEGFGFAEYDLAHDGTLVYVPGVSQLYGQIAYVGPDGKFDTLPFPRGQYTQPRLSPDGTRLAAQMRKPIGGWEVLVLDLETGVRQRVPVEGNFRAYPASWSPDGTLMIGLWAPVQNLTRGARIFSLEQGTWEEVANFRGSYISIAPNARDFVFSDWRTGDLFIRAIRGDTTQMAIPARGTAASFSPDGRWVAWGAVDGGVAVSPVPPTGAIYPVAERGQQPLWSPDSRTLIYRDGRRFYQLPYSTTSGFRTGRPTLLAEGPFIRTFAWNHTIGPDGRLAALISAPGESTRELGVITHFDQVLTRLAPPRR